MINEIRVFDAFINGDSFNHFEAEKISNYHCLHTTVTTMEQKYNIAISCKFETVPGYMGNPTSVCRYWIDIKERERIKSERYDSSNLHLIWMSNVD
jgi:hypothetical protein